MGCDRYGGDVGGLDRVQNAREGASIRIRRGAVGCGSSGSRLLSYLMS